MNFKNYLKTNNLTQTEIANKLKVTQSAVSLWVLGKCSPKFGTMQKLADALDVDLITIVNCFTEKDKSEE